MSASNRKHEGKEKEQEHGRLTPERSAIIRNPEIVNETHRRADEVHRAAEVLHETIRQVEANVASMKARHAKPPTPATDSAAEPESRRRKSRAKSDASR